MSTPLDDQIALWRHHLAGRPAVGAAEVDELEDHLRAHIEGLKEVGLSDDEAFLIGVKRLGSHHEIAREFARENSQRLWKQLVLDDRTAREAGSGGRGGWRPMLAFAIAAALVATAPAWFGVTIEADFEFYVRNVSLLGFAGTIAYLLWRHGASRALVGATAAAVVIIAVAANLYAREQSEDLAAMTALHIPVALWVVIGLAYAAQSWRAVDARMDYLRFTGEWLIYAVLIQTVSMVLVGLVAVVPTLVGLDPSGFMSTWLIPAGAAAAAVVATWMVEAKKAIIENMAPVLARVFTPLFTIVFVALLMVVLASGPIADINRDLLIACDAILLVALGLILFNLTARGSGERATWFDGVQLGLVGAALLLDAVALTNILVRIGDGWTFNRAVVLGANVILLINLTVTAWLFVRLLRGAPATPRLEKWQTRLIPVYGAWALVVAVALPPLFDFA